MVIKQYQIVLVNLDSTQGSEINKIRPCLIISPDEMNDNLRTVTVAPMTTTGKPYPTRVKIVHHSQTGWAVIDQVRTIDKSRIIRALGGISLDEINMVKAVIRETFVD